MKIAKQKQSRKKYLVGFAIVLLLLVAAGSSYALYAQKNSLWPFTSEHSPTQATSSNQSPTVDKNTSNHSTGDTGSKDPSSTGGTTGSTTTNPKTTDTPQPTLTKPKTIPVTISASQETAQSVTVFTQIQKVTDGSCTLTVTNGLKSITKKADVLYRPDSSICEGFSIDVATLGKGKWSFTLDVTSGNSKGSAQTTLEVQ